MAQAVRSIGSRASAPASLASCTWRALIACQLSSSQSTLDGMVVIQPQRKLSRTGDGAARNASVARRSGTAPAGRPSAMSVARLSSSTSDGRGGAPPGGGGGAGRGGPGRGAPGGGGPAAGAPPPPRGEG